MLYELHSDKADDYYMTASSAAAQAKESDGYVQATEGTVFSYRVHGTVAIGLDDGTAYIYQRPETGEKAGLNMAPLWKLTRGGDFFYTWRPAEANTAQANGWTRSTAGYVSTS